MKEQNLQLSLKRQWFEITKSGVKTEDYRSITARWCNRFLTYQGVNRDMAWWEREFISIDGRLSDGSEIKENVMYFCEFKPFSHNIMTLGYPKSTDTSRILKLEHKGIEIRTGNTELGGEPNKLYFVIKHGEIL